MLHDLRFALRTLAGAPKFTLVAVLSIALGIAAATSIFSFVQAMLVAPLPFAGSDRIVVISEAERGEEVTASPARFADWALAPGIEAVSGFYSESVTANLTGVPERMAAIWSFQDLLATLQVRPALGRGFTARELEQAAPVVLVSDSFWRARLEAAPHAIGRTIRVNGAAREIVGVLPAGVELEDAQLILPESSRRFGRTARFLLQLARLRPGVPIESANSQLATVAERLRREYPKTDRELTARAIPYREVLGATVKAPLLILLGAVLFVLLMACLNVASLSLSRVAARTREISVRQALGAGRARIVRLLLTESALIAVAGGALGVLGSAWSIGLLRAAAPADLARVGEVGIDGPVLWFSVLLVAAATLCAGLFPALRHTRVDARSTHRAQRVLAAMQIGLSLALMAGGGLLLRSLWMLENRGLNFQPARLVSFQLSLPWQTDPAVLNRTYTSVLERVSQIPGVEGAALTDRLPLGGGAMDAEPVVDGAPAAAGTLGIPAGLRLNQRVVSPGLHTLLGVPLVAGRHLANEDRKLRRTVINAAAARMLFRGADPIGHTLALRWSGSIPPPAERFEIVGVLADVPARTRDRQVEPAMFIAFDHTFWPIAHFVVKTRGNPSDAVPSIRAAVAQVDPDHAMERVQTVDEFLYERNRLPRLQARVTAVFAGLALLLAAVGVYGLMANSVAARAREIAIRMALGAQPGEVVAGVLRAALWTAACGAAAGLGLAAAVARVLRSTLYGVSAADPAVFAATLLALALVLVPAAWWPARRAARLDPMRVLREN